MGRIRRMEWKKLIDFIVGLIEFYILISMLLGSIFAIIYFIGGD